MDCCERTYKETIEEVIKLIDDKDIKSTNQLKIILGFVLEKLNDK